VEFTRILPVSTTSASAARTALVAVAPKVDGRLLEDARLVVTELVSNVVRHSGLGDSQTFELRVILQSTLLRLEVRYDAAAFRAEAGAPSAEGDRGRGLLIVQSLTDRWGVLPQHGVTAWAEWDLIGASPGSRFLRAS
jgi:anti-sigma regulatory factor (Ser/Thr protein kinase)